MRRKVSIPAEIDLSDFDTDDLVAEVADRRANGDYGPMADDEFLERDLDLLSDLIAEGKTRDALDQLRRLFPQMRHPKATMTFAAVRQQQPRIAG